MHLRSGNSNRRIENLEGVGELEEKMQMLMQRFSFLETT